MATLNWFKIQHACNSHHLETKSSNSENKESSTCHNNKNLIHRRANEIHSPLEPEAVVQDFFVKHIKQILTE